MKTAAGPKAGDVETTAVASSAGRMTIVHSNGAPEDDHKRQAEQGLMRSLFEKAHPDATIHNSTWQFSPDTFFAKSIAGTLPDVIGVFATEATLILDKRMSADITDQVRGWKLFPQVNQRMLEPISREGRIYGLPIGGIGGFYVMTLFYNNDLFKAAGLVDADGEPVPPQTWDDLTTYAVRLTNRERGVAGYGILGEIGGNAWHFLNYGWQAGGDFERRGPDGRWTSVFHEPPVVRALEFVKDLRWKHDVLQRNVLANNDELFQLFSSGRIAMVIFTPEYIPYLVDKYSMPYSKIGICLLPAGPGGRANQTGGSYLLVNPRLSGTRKQRTFDSIVFPLELEALEQQVKLLHEQGRPVGVPCIPLFKPEYQEKINAIVDRYRNVPDLTGLMQEAVNYVRPEPPFRCQTLYDMYIGPAIQEALVNSDADCAEILARASRRFQLRELDPVNEDIRKSGSNPPSGEASR